MRGRFAVGLCECGYPVWCSSCMSCAEHCTCDPDDFDADELGLDPEEDYRDA